MEYKTILKNLLIEIVSVILIILSSKIFMFYIPFLIAYCISIILEPIIKYINKKTKLSRKTSSVLTLGIFFAIFFGFIIWAVITLVKESNELLSGLNTYMDKTMQILNELLEKININKFQLSDEIEDLIHSTSSDIFNKIMDFIKNSLTNFLERIKSIPKFFIYLVITILATYFITSDKFYILDRLEHHIPKNILGKVNIKIDKITKSLGGYLKAELIMIGISFIIVLMGLNIFYLCGMNVGYPLIMAIFIGFVDALPILGAGTVMIPWCIISFFNKDSSVGFAILGLYILTIVVRQLLEPKIVSNKIGVHPIFTLIAMYTGYKFIGILGMLIGPIVLIILKNIFENSLDKGIVKSIMEE